MFLDWASQNEIISAAKSFKSGKAAGYDNIPMDTIK